MRPHCCAHVCSTERWHCCAGCCARGLTPMQVRWHLTCMLLSMAGLDSFHTVPVCGEPVGMLPDLQLPTLPLATALPRFVWWHAGDYDGRRALHIAAGGHCTQPQCGLVLGLTDPTILYQLCGKQRWTARPSHSWHSSSSFVPAAEGHLPAVEALISGGADPTVQDRWAEGRAWDRLPEKLPPSKPRLAATGGCVC